MKPAARVLVRRSPHRSVGAVHAPHLQADPIEWESPWENAFVHIAIGCPVVAHVTAQPFKLEYIDSLGRKRTHVPDYLVRLRSGARLVVEVKTTAYLDEHREKFDRSSEVLCSRGAWYYVVTEKQLSERLYWQLLIWRRYARAPVDATQVERALRCIRNSESGCTVADLMTEEVSLSTHYHLLGRKALAASTGREIHQDSVLTFFQCEASDERDLFDRWIGCTTWRPDLSVDS
jgi:hypothetical protein